MVQVSVFRDCEYLVRVEREKRVENVIYLVLKLGIQINLVRKLVWHILSSRVSSSASSQTLTLVSIVLRIAEAGFRNGGWERPHTRLVRGPGRELTRLSQPQSDDWTLLRISWCLQQTVCVSLLWLQSSLDPDQYSWSCNFMCSWSVKEKCHFTIKYNFIVKWTCPKRTLLPLLTVKCWNLEEYHLVSYQVQKIEYWRQQPTSSSVLVQLILPGPALMSFLPLWPISLLG